MATSKYDGIASIHHKLSCIMASSSALKQGTRRSPYLTSSSSSRKPRCQICSSGFLPRTHSFFPKYFKSIKTRILYIKYDSMFDRSQKRQLACLYFFHECHGSVHCIHGHFHGNSDFQLCLSKMTYVGCIWEPTLLLHNKLGGYRILSQLGGVGYHHLLSFL